MRGQRIQDALSPQTMQRTLLKKIEAVVQFYRFAYDRELNLVEIHGMMTVKRVPDPLRISGMVPTQRSLPANLLDEGETL